MVKGVKSGKYGQKVVKEVKSGKVVKVVKSGKCGQKPVKELKSGKRWLM